MAIWYVDDAATDNTGTGKTTGSPKKYLWSEDGVSGSALFLEALDADRPAVGDIIYVLDGHAENINIDSNQLLTDNAKGTNSNPIWIVTVDSLSSPTAYGSKGNSVLENVYNRNFALSGCFVVQGLKLSTGEVLSFSGAEKRSTLFDGVMAQTASGEAAGVGEKHRLDVIDSDFDLGVSSDITVGKQGGALDLFGLDVIDANTVHVVLLGSEGVYFNCIAADLDGFSSTIFGALPSSGGGTYTVARSKIDSGVGAVSSFGRKGHKIQIDGGTGDQYYDVLNEEVLGTLELDEAVYRASSTYDGTNEYSFLMSSNADVANSRPFPSYREKICTLIDQDLTSSKTVTVEICQWDSTETATPDALDIHEFRIGIVRPDETDQALGVVQFSHDMEIFDTSPADITTSSVTWNKTTYIRKQKLTITIPALTGVTKGQVDVYAFLSKQSIEVNICPDIDIS